MKFKLGFKEEENMIRLARGGRSFKVERRACSESLGDEKDLLLLLFHLPLSTSPLPIPELSSRRLA